MKSVKAFVRGLLKNTSKLTKVSCKVNDENEITVSIHCFVFNQEKYISRCLDSFLNQFVDFGVEILVHDDCSSDNSKKIIEAYRKKYPGIIKPIYEEKNIYSRTGNFLEIAEIVNGHSKGSFIAVCEGDDYWTDPLKLFLQVSVMQKYSDCHFCVHRVDVASGNNNYISRDKQIPAFRMSTRFLNDKTFISLVNDKYNFQTSSYFFRKKDYDILFNTKPMYMTLMPTDDEVLLRHFGSMGKTCFINRGMSVYLQYTDGSWSKEHKDNAEDLKRNRFIKAVNEFDIYTAKKYHKSCKQFLLKIEVFSLIKMKRYDEIFKDKELRNTMRRIDYKTYISLRIRRLIRK